MVKNETKAVCNKIVAELQERHEKAYGTKLMFDSSGIFRHLEEGRAYTPLKVFFACMLAEAEKRSPQSLIRL